MRFDRSWAMPSRWTFSIKPIAELLAEYVTRPEDWVDPFCGRSTLAAHSNDLIGGVDAREYLQSFGYILGCLLDPPYSPRQITECYRAIGKTVTQLDTRNSALYKEVKDMVAFRQAVGGIVISCAWNSTGMGIKRGYEIERILLVCHGAAHNDTIVTVERKTSLSRFDTTTEDAT